MTSKGLRKENGRLRMGSTLGYAIGAVGEGIGYNVFFSFFIFFLTTVAGIAPAVAGVISSIAVLWDAVTDPIIGNWSDRTKNPKGRRRPFIMTGSVLFGISIALLFINISMPENLKIVYFIIVNALYWVTLTSCVIPHISLGSELTEDFDERTKLRTWAVTLMGIGTLIATSTPLLLVNFYSSIFGTESIGWACTGITFGVVIALVYNICCAIIKKKEPTNPNIEREEDEASGGKREVLSTFWGNAKKAFKNKSLTYLLVITFMVNVVVTLGGGLMVYLLTYVYKFGDGQTSTVYLVQGILVIVAALVAGYVAKQTEKKIVMIGGIILYGMAYLIVLIFPVCMTTIYVSLIVYALGNSSYWTMIYAMSYDTAIVEQIRSGDKPDGLYTSLIGLLMKFGNSLGTLIVGFGLQFIGFSSTATVQTAATVSGIKLLYGIAPTVVLAIGLIFACLYPITKKKYRELVDVYHRKEAGESYDEKVLDNM
ncbi:MAG: MFS transporter [Clostridiales bacterium]|nr:MFS transporter [Clostridiales bacterium]